MTGANEQTRAGLWNPWRIARWSAALVVLMIPAVMMQISDEWHWTPASFVLAGTVIGGLLLLYEYADRLNGSRAYRAGVAIVLLASFLTVWTTIVRDDGNGIGFFLLIMAAAVSALAARFEAAGMARAMLGIAIMQALLGIAIATAPVTTRVEGEPMRAMLFNCFFAVLWLISAALFRTAAKGGAESGC